MSCAEGPIRVVHQTNWPVVRTILSSWFDYMEKCISCKEIHIIFFCLISGQLLKSILVTHVYSKHSVHSIYISRWSNQEDKIVLTTGRVLPPSTANLDQCQSGKLIRYNIISGILNCIHVRIPHLSWSVFLYLLSGCCCVF